MGIHDAYKDELEEETRGVEVLNETPTIETVSPEIKDATIIQSRMSEDMQVFEGDKYRLAVSLDQQVAASSWLSANALYTIKKYNLHNLIGEYEDFDDLVRKRYPFLGLATAKRFVRIVETLGQGPDVKELFNVHSSKKLIEIAKEVEKEESKIGDDGKEYVVVNGEMIEKSVFTKQVAEEIEKEYQKKIEDLEFDLDTAKAKNERVEKNYEKLNEKLTEQDKKLTALAKAKKIDPEMLIVIENTTDAKNKITECLETISNQFDLLERIPYEHRNAHLATQILHTFSMIQHRITGLEKNWLDHIELVTSHGKGE